MFAWQYLKRKEKLQMSREEAHTVHQLAQLARCMPGAAAHVGGHPQGMSRLLFDVVGSGRPIFAFEHGDRDGAPMPAAAAAVQPAPSTLPGLQSQEVSGPGIHLLGGDLETAFRCIPADQRFCFVHCCQMEAGVLLQVLRFFLPRLAAGGLMLVTLPEPGSAQGVASIIRSSIASGREKAVFLKTPHCLLLRPPERLTRATPRSRVRTRTTQLSLAS